MRVDVRLTDEEKRLVPDWEEQVATFQRTMNKVERDKRERFRLALHEGAHSQQIRKLGWGVKFYGPYVYFDHDSGEVVFVHGAVLPIGYPKYKPFDWQHAIICASGFLLVEHFTAVPDSPYTIQHDLKTLRSDLGENGDINDAMFYAKIVLFEDVRTEPTFISELEQTCRDYEMNVYGNTEATEWGWREYRPELKGTRHHVSVITRGYHGTLFENGDELTLLTEGEVFRPGDEIRGTKLEVMSWNPEKAGADRAVRRWNEAVSCEIITG